MKITVGVSNLKVTEVSFSLHNDRWNFAWQVKGTTSMFWAVTGSPIAMKPTSWRSPPSLSWGSMASQVNMIEQVIEQYSTGAVSESFKNHSVPFCTTRKWGYSLIADLLGKALVHRHTFCSTLLGISDFHTITDTLLTHYWHSKQPLSPLSLLCLLHHASRFWHLLSLQSCEPRRARVAIYCKLGRRRPGRVWQKWTLNKVWQFSGSAVHFEFCWQRLRKDPQHAVGLALNLPSLLWLWICLQRCKLGACRPHKAGCCNLPQHAEFTQQSDLLGWCVPRDP